MSYSGQRLVRLSVQTDRQTDPPPRAAAAAGAAASEESDHAGDRGTGAAVMAALQATPPYRVVPWGHHDEATLNTPSAGAKPYSVDLRGALSVYSHTGLTVRAGERLAVTGGCRVGEMVLPTPSAGVASRVGSGCRLLLWFARWGSVVRCWCFRTPSERLEDRHVSPINGFMARWGCGGGELKGWNGWVCVWGRARACGNGRQWASSFLVRSNCQVRRLTRSIWVRVRLGLTLGRVRAKVREG